MHNSTVAPELLRVASGGRNLLWEDLTVAPPQVWTQESRTGVWREGADSGLNCPIASSDEVTLVPLAPSGSMPCWWLQLLC